MSTNDVWYESHCFVVSKFFTFPDMSDEAVLFEEVKLPISPPIDVDEPVPESEPVLLPPSVVVPVMSNNGHVRSALTGKEYDPESWNFQPAASVVKWVDRQTSEEPYDMLEPAEQQIFHLRHKAPPTKRLRDETCRYYHAKSGMTTKVVMGEYCGIPWCECSPALYFRHIGYTSSRCPTLKATGVFDRFQPTKAELERAKTFDHTMQCFIMTTIHELTHESSLPVTPPLAPDIHTVVPRRKKYSPL